MASLMTRGLPSGVGSYEISGAAVPARISLSEGRFLRDRVVPLEGKSDCSGGADFFGIVPLMVGICTHDTRATSISLA